MRNARSTSKEGLPESLLRRCGARLHEHLEGIPVGARKVDVVAETNERPRKVDRHVEEVVDVAGASALLFLESFANPRKGRRRLSGYYEVPRPVRAVMVDDPEPAPILPAARLARHHVLFHETGHGLATGRETRQEVTVNESSVAVRDEQLPAVRQGRANERRFSYFLSLAGRFEAQFRRTSVADRPRKATHDNE